MSREELIKRSDELVTEVHKTLDASKHKEKIAAYRKLCMRTVKLQNFVTRNAPNLVLTIQIRMVEETLKEFKSDNANLNLLDAVFGERK